MFLTSFSDVYIEKTSYIDEDHFEVRQCGENKSGVQLPSNGPVMLNFNLVKKNVDSEVILIKKQEAINFVKQYIVENTKDIKFKTLGNYKTDINSFLNQNSDIKIFNLSISDLKLGKYYENNKRSVRKYCAYIHEPDFTNKTSKQNIEYLNENISERFLLNNNFIVINVKDADLLISLNLFNDKTKNQIFIDNLLSLLEEKDDKLLFDFVKKDEIEQMKDLFSEFLKTDRNSTVIKEFDNKKEKLNTIFSKIKKGEIKADDIKELKEITVDMSKIFALKKSPEIFEKMKERREEIKDKLFVYNRTPLIDLSDTVNTFQMQSSWNNSTAEKVGVLDAVCDYYINKIDDNRLFFNNMADIQKNFSALINNGINDQQSYPINNIPGPSIPTNPTPFPTIGGITNRETFSEKEMQEKMKELEKKALKYENFKEYYMQEEYNTIKASEFGKRMLCSVFIFDKISNLNEREFNDFLISQNRFLGLDSEKLFWLGFGITVIGATCITGGVVAIGSAAYYGTLTAGVSGAYGWIGIGAFTSFWDSITMIVSYDIILNEHM
ncbi:MAG: hypothetical protein M0R46_09470 [Candidatus Muirbacterium halophilum]|nr:hypothetical protein [Candidatus Muirbacterium halophilum]